MSQKIKVRLRRTAGRKDLFWITTAIISMVIYIGWRTFFTLPDHEVYGWLATICGVLLLLSEGISMLEGTEHFLRLGKKAMPDMPVVPPERFPHVDILISTHNEETELLYKTINGCKHMKYPDLNKVHIYVCDDGNRPEMAKLASDMGVGYFGLADNKDAKAGNLNHALSKTGSPWVVTFDADMIPTRDFLMETVPYIFLPEMKELDDGTWVDREEDELDEDFKIGFIQTPQSFYNPDLFQFNFFSETRIPNEQDYFFREVNVGRNNANASIYAGSNTLISRQALEDVGGIATGTITEDFETGIRIQAKGYRCYALNKSLAHGLAPTDVDSLIKQRVRWGRGCIKSLRRVHVLLNPHLKFNMKVSYVACLMYWWTFFRRFIFILSPILFILFHIPVVICSLPELLLIWLPSFVLYNQALKVTSGKIRNKRWSNTVDTVIFPYMIIPIFLESIFISQKKFHVTKKTRELTQQRDLQLAIPHMLLLVLDVAALVIAVVDTIRTRNVGAVVIIYWLMINALHLTMAIFFMSGRRNYRNTDRFYVRYPVEIQYMDRLFYGVTSDLSETGMSVLVDQSIYMPHGDDSMILRIKSDTYHVELEARCTHVDQRDQDWKYGIQITKLEGKNKDEYFQLLYDHEHSLATTMKPSVSMLDDIFLNIQRRSAPTTQSKRALPRMELNREFSTTDGRNVTVVDTNYEFVKLDTTVGLPDRMELIIPGSTYTIVCTAVPGKPELYQVENWKTLVFHDVFDFILGQEPQKAPEARTAAV